MSIFIQFLFEQSSVSFSFKRFRPESFNFALLEV